MARSSVVRHGRGRLAFLTADRFARPKASNKIILRLQSHMPKNKWRSGKLILFLAFAIAGSVWFVAGNGDALAQTVSIPSESSAESDPSAADIPEDLFRTEVDQFATARVLLHGMLLGLLLGLAAFHLARFIYADIRISLATFALLLAAFFFEYTIFGYHEAFSGERPELSGAIRAGAAAALAVVAFHFLRRFLAIADSHPNYDLFLRILFYGSLFALAVAPFNAAIALLMVQLTLFVGVVGISVVVALLSQEGHASAQMGSPGVLLLALAFLGQGLLQLFGLQTIEMWSVMIHLLFVIGLLLLSYAVLSEADTAAGEAMTALPSPTASPTLPTPNNWAQQAVLESDNSGEDQMAGRVALALAATGEGIWDWDVLNETLFLSAEAEQLVGIEPGSFDGSSDTWLSLMSERDVADFRDLMFYGDAQTQSTFVKSFRVLGGSEQERLLELQASYLREEDGSISRCVGMLRNIDERAAVEYRPIDNGLVDVLTNVLTRSAFMTQLEEHLKDRDQQQDVHSELFIIDLDRFKVVNEGVGHAGGDQLLAGVAERLSAFSGESDIVGRLAGDEFAILLNRQGGNANTEGIADLILDLLSRPFEIGNREVFLSASIGFVLLNQSYQSAGEALQSAELAAQEAKRAGGGQWREYVPTMRGKSDGTDSSVSVHAELRRALEREEIELHYQPIFALEGRRIAGFEALLRWRHPKRGVLGADQFIPIAEETGIIVDLGRFALSLASVQLYQWQAFFPLTDPLFVSVNMSSRELLRPDLVSEFEEITGAVTVAPGTLKVELTESQVLHDEEIASTVLEKLRALGAGLALDDFGTGYSALSRLKKYQFNTLKVDRSFISAIDTEEQAPVITKTIVDLAHELGMDVIAEGVEIEAHVELLREMGCDYGQGFHFGAAMTAEDAQKFIALHWAN